jgi:hypothetical protein
MNFPPRRIPLARPFHIAKRKAFSMSGFFIPSEARDPYRFDMPLEDHFHIKKPKRILLKTKGILYEKVA